MHKGGIVESAVMSMAVLLYELYMFNSFSKQRCHMYMVAFIIICKLLDTNWLIFPHVTYISSCLLSLK
jgi:hypothetical protein